MLINTPQGKMIAPLLEQMGATRAIPLSTNVPSASAPSAAPSAAPMISQSAKPADLSCLSPWTDYPVSMILTHLQHCARTAQSEVEHSIIKLSYLLYQKNKECKPCFSALESCIQYIDAVGENEQLLPLLYDLFYLMAFNLPSIIEHIAPVTTFASPLLTQFVTSIMTQLLVISPSSPLYLAYTLCLSILTTTSYKEEMRSNSLFDTFLQSITSTLDRDNSSSYHMGILLLANLVRVLPQRREEDDPQEEVLLLLQVLSEGICDEQNEEILRMRIAGLLMLVEKGGMVEKITLQSQGVCSDSRIQVNECIEMWNKLVALCENYYCLLSCRLAF